MQCATFRRELNCTGILVSVPCAGTDKNVMKKISTQNKEGVLRDQKYPLSTMAKMKRVRNNRRWKMPYVRGNLERVNVVG